MNKEPLTDTQARIMDQLPLNETVEVNSSFHFTSLTALSEKGYIRLWGWEWDHWGDVELDDDGIPSGVRTHKIVEQCVGSNISQYTHARKVAKSYRKKRKISKLEELTETVKKLQKHIESIK